jgi:hypothetical protein
MRMDSSRISKNLRLVKITYRLISAVFLIFYGAQESISRNRFRQPMKSGGPVRQSHSYSVPGPHRLFKNSSTVSHPLDSTTMMGGGRGGCMSEGFSVWGYFFLHRKSTVYGKCPFLFFGYAVVLNGRKCLILVVHYS